MALRRPAPELLRPRPHRAHAFACPGHGERLVDTVHPIHVIGGHERCPSGTASRCRTGVSAFGDPAVRFCIVHPPLGGRCVSPFATRRAVCLSGKSARPSNAQRAGVTIAFTPGLHQ